MSAMAKSKPLQQEDEKPQPRIEVTKSSPKNEDKKAGKEASAAPSSGEDNASQATVIMQAPSAFEQLVEKILKKHKI